MPNPIINPAILLSPVENGYVAYDPVCDRLHQLNPMAALLAELCDGTRSPADIRAIAGPLLPEGEADQIDRWIAEGTRTGLLAPSADIAAGHRELSGDELYRLSKRLDETGKVQTAFLCGKRAVELKPDNPDAWYSLGEIAQCAGRRAEARVAYEKYLEFHPEDAEIRHLVVALRDEAPPPRAPNDTIQHIYRHFAATYESQMRDDLKYQGPERIQDAIRSVMGDRSGLAVLDLGCGSGLSGVALKPWAAHMAGVDLSPEMIALASARGIYDRLEVAEITEWLDRTTESFDLAVACDCLIYFGDLELIARLAAKRLKPGGAFVMSMERGERYPFQLTDSGRYTHHPGHVREVAAAAGLRVASLEEAFLRMEYGVEVTGLFAALKKDGG